METPSVVDVVVRCRNEMPWCERTLSALANQRGVIARVVFFDCASTDGSREVAVSREVPVVDVDPKRYRPGEVLNRGMRLTTSDVVAFVNADAIPSDPDALLRLVEPFARAPGLGAAFGRQVPRLKAAPTTRLDHARAFGAAAPASVRHGAFFSMAASAVRRSAWLGIPFDESLQYSEDVDFTLRIGAIGWQVQYVPEARFEHSHDYDLAAQVKRRHGEGAAETAIFRLGHPSPVRELVRPLAGALLRDARAGILSPRAATIRAAQAVGFYAGRLSASLRGITPARPDAALRSP